MSALRQLRLRVFLIISLVGFGVHLGTAIAAAQRVLITIGLLLAAIFLSATLTQSIIVSDAQALSIAQPSATLLSQVNTAPNTIEPTVLQRPEATTLLTAYKAELANFDQNRELLSNIILLSSTLGLEKEVSYYRRKLYLADPLLSCVFSQTESGLLKIVCPPNVL